MSEATNMDSRAAAGEWLSARFEDLRDEDAGGWSGLCPLCDSETRVFISRVLKVSPCPNGHTPVLIHRVLDRTPTRLGLKPISVLLAEAIPDTEWLVSPWIESASIGAIVAPPNLGKTLLAFYFATLVACGKRRVAIIEEEGGKRGFQKRVDRAVRAVGGERTCDTIDFSFKPRLHLMSLEDREAMCEELSGYQFVVIDSLARVITGVEENDAKEMGQIIDTLDVVRERTGATVFTVHHTAKSKWKPGEIPRIGDGRGSSAFEAGLDTVLALSPVEGKEPGLVQFELHVTKQRDEDNQVTPQLVRISMKGPAAVVEMEDVDVRRDTVQEPFMRFRQAVLDAVPVEPDSTTRTKLAKSIPGTKADKFKCIAWLLRNGSIHEDRDENIYKKRSPSEADENTSKSRGSRGLSDDGPVF